VEVAVPTVLDQEQVDAALADRHPDWRGSPQKLSRSIEFADFPTAVEFINRIAPRCEALDHHPDLAVRWRWVDVELSTHSAGGVTDLDLAVAEIVDEVAVALPQATPD
jgi:4a-hydroxytetrahydrobiopterin dehydratase